MSFMMRRSWILTWCDRSVAEAEEKEEVVAEVLVVAVDGELWNHPGGGTKEEAAAVQDRLF